MTVARFPRGLYSDVRVERVSSTVIAYTLGRLDEFRERDFTAAFVRVFDGDRWYYSAVSELASVQGELDALASAARPRLDIEDHPVVKRLEANVGDFEGFAGSSVSGVDPAAKHELLRRSFSPLSDRSLVKSWRGAYMDRHTRKHILSSKGADLRFDTQTTGLFVLFELSEGDRRFRETEFDGTTGFDELESLEGKLSARLDQSESFLRESRPVDPGEYTVILSPFAAGIFAHESFGHKSEADFMIGDDAMMREWAVGSRVGPEALSIVDDGSVQGGGFTPFDDEGTRSRKTYLIRNGILSGRLHSSVTAAALNEEPTGNGRSIGFEYEPIPRMTTTYIEPGTMSRDELFEGVDEGLFVETVLHGSGLSTFTLAPSLSYLVRHGRIAEPVNVSVITGNVMETLGMIDGLSDELEIVRGPGGGCGKHEQYPLSVSFGGPYVRVRGMNVS
ncbi:TldD/PmbA family protein [Candidatus Fermentibacterales bacterium]|nr:TldD/PmbA family protein [Candidatus Fermentibacterales bacterium]